MKSFLIKLKKYPMIFVFLFIMLLYLPTSLTSQAESDKYAITNAVGIDKEDGQYKVSALVHVPKPNANFEEKYNIVSGKGDNISLAINQIELNIGKELGVVHTGVLVVGKAVFEDDLSKVLDSFIRTTQLSNNTTIVYSEDNAYDILMASTKSQSATNFKLNEIVSYNKNKILGNSADIQDFYTGYFSNGKSSKMSVVKLEPETGEGFDISQGDSSSGGGQSTGSSGGGSIDSSSSGGSQDSQEKKLSDTGEIALFKNGKLAGKLSKEEVKGLNWISKDISYGSFVVKGYSGNGLTNADITFQVKKKTVTPFVSYVNGYPVIDYQIYLSLVIQEIKSEDNKQINYYLQENFIDNNLKNLIDSTLREELGNAIAKLKQYNADIINVYNDISINNRIKFNKFLSLSGANDDYLQYVRFGLTTNIDVKN